VPDEFPSLEFAATAVALALGVRVLVLLGRGSKLVSGKERVERARARDLVGAALLVGAVLYVVRVGRASDWFLVAAGVALLAQMTGFLLSSRLSAPPVLSRSSESGRAADVPALEVHAEEELEACASCGSLELVELEGGARWLGELAQYGVQNLTVCRNCGALSGDVERAGQLPLGAPHGTRLLHAKSDAEALEEPEEHQG
jgi:hypothetical protein